MALTYLSLFVIIQFIPGEALEREKDTSGINDVPSPNIEETGDGIESLVLGFRLWMIIAFVLVGLLIILVVLCCIFDCRVPRTKQEIDADYERKEVASKVKISQQKRAGHAYKVIRGKPGGPVLLPPTPTLLHDTNLQQLGKQRHANRHGYQATSNPTPLVQQPNRFLRNNGQIYSPQRQLGTKGMRAGEIATSRTLASLYDGNEFAYERQPLY